MYLLIKALRCFIYLNSNFSKIKLFHILHDLRIVKRPIDISNIQNLTLLQTHIVK